MQHTIQTPDLLAQAFAIAAGDSPLRARRDHVKAVVEHGRAWTTTLMATASTAPAQTIRCQHAGCVDGFVDGERGKTECPVCDGNSIIDFSVVAEYARQIDAMQRSLRTLADEKQKLQSRLRHYELMEGQHARLTGVIEFRKPAAAIATLGGAA